MRFIALLPLLVAGTRNLSLTRGVVKTRVLFSGALAQIIVRFYPLCKPCDGSPTGTVRHMWVRSFLRSAGFTAVMVAFAVAAAGCDGAGARSNGPRAGGTPPAATPPPRTPPAAPPPKGFPCSRGRAQGQTPGHRLGRAAGR